MKTMMNDVLVAEKIKLTTTYRKMLADSFTPVSVYRIVRDRFPKSILLESSDYNSSENSYSFICFDPLVKFEVKDNFITIESDHMENEKRFISDREAIGNEFNGLLNSISFNKLPFTFPYNGFFGYMNYDMVAHFDDIPVKKNEESDIPQMIYHYTDMYWLSIISRMKLTFLNIR